MLNRPGAHRRPGFFVEDAMPKGKGQSQYGRKGISGAYKGSKKGGSKRKGTKAY